MATTDSIEALIAAFEPRARRAIAALLASVAEAGKVSTLEAFIRQGDLEGLGLYVQSLYVSTAPAALAELLAIVRAAAALAERDIDKAGIGRPAPVAAAPIGDIASGIVIPGDGAFAYNPANPRTIAATRTWQGNLIREMGLTARRGIMAAVREGIIAGDSPRAVARRIKVALPLTESQQTAVGNFQKELQRIADDGIRSATTWGIYTPKQIAALKANDPAAFRALNFTSREIAQGRRWGKISRAAGTLAAGPDGVKPSKPLGFVEPPDTQGGGNAYRIGADGKTVDRMSAWRVRDKTFDPLIYDIVAAREAGDDAAEAAARAKLDARVDAMATRYRERMTARRAETIARTETLRAANLGSFEGWRQATEETGLFEPGEIKRRWVTAGGERVRMAHRAASGQVVSGFQQPFRVDGDAVLFPPHGVACRCGVSYDVDLSGGLTP